VLAVGGFLEGRMVTGLKSQLALLSTLAPSAHIDDSLPFIDDGDVVTAGGAATSLDAALHLVRRLTDDETARWVAEDYLDHHSSNPGFRGKAV